MNFKIEKVLERDIDLLIINNFINNKLLNLFMCKTSLDNYKIISVEHSYKDIDYGESDITVIIEKDNHKIGLLIEDKIDAPAMELQPERYIERGKIGVNNKTYDEYKTIIIAPEQYLNTNLSVNRYQYKISYEEVLKVLNDDIYAVTLLTKAIKEKKNGYNVIENEMVTKFWKKYYDYIRNYYPEIKIHELNGPRGSNACWPEFKTDYKQVKIIHKSNKGYIDLTFNNMANHIDIFNKYINNSIHNYKIVETGKSLSIRIDVPIIDFKNDFDNYINEIHECMEFVLKLYDILSNINVLMMYSEIEK